MFQKDVFLSDIIANSPANGQCYRIADSRTVSTVLLRLNAVRSLIKNQLLPNSSKLISWSATLSPLFRIVS